MLNTQMQTDSSQISPLKAIHDLARRNKISVEYQVEKESGPAHAKIYTVRLRLGEKEYTGVDRSIKLAQRAAAQNALDEHKHLSSTDTPNHEQKQHQSPTVALNTWATQNHILTRYILLNEEHLLSTNNHPQIIFSYRLYVGNNFYFDGHGSSHQRARTHCAYHALNFIQQNQISIPTENNPKSRISLMYERARQLGLPVRIEHNEPLTITYHIGEEYSTTGTGQTKHAAKENAAEKMLAILPLVQEKVKTKPTRKHSNQHKKFIEQKGSNNYSLSEEINPITRLYQIGRVREQKVEFIQMENTDSFHFHVKLGDNDFADGYDKNKQSAKRLAAENLLSKLNSTLLESIVISLPPAPKKGLLKHEMNSKNQPQEKKHVHFVDD
jgi:double-stranded RNA-binding protein Staufen